MKNIIQFSLIVLVYSIFLNGASAYGQQKKKVEKRKIKARTLCLNRASVTPDIYTPAAEGSYKILLPVQSYSNTFDCVIEDGVANFYKEEGVGADGKPKRIIVAKTAVKGSIRKALFFFNAIKPKGNILYKVRVLDDSKQSFPLGNTRVINLCKLPTDIKIGEHHKKINPAKMVTLGLVKKRSASNMVNVTSRIQKADKSWVTYSEFRSRFTKEMRVLMVSFYDTASGQPKVKIYKDIPLAAEPAPEPEIK